MQRGRNYWPWWLWWLYHHYDCDSEYWILCSRSEVKSLHRKSNEKLISTIYFYELRRRAMYVTLRRFCAVRVVVEKTIIITYPECMFVALVIHHTMSTCHIVIFGLCGSTIYIYPHYVINGTIFEKKNKCLVWKISRSKRKWAIYDQKCSLVFM